MTDKYRKAFEKWATGYGVFPQWDDDHGIYDNQLSQFMFRAFQAAYNLRSAEVERLREALEED